MGCGHRRQTKRAASCEPVGRPALRAEAAHTADDLTGLGESQSIGETLRRDDGLEERRRAPRGRSRGGKPHAGRMAERGRSEHLLTGPRYQSSVGAECDVDEWLSPESMQQRQCGRPGSKPPKLIAFEYWNWPQSCMRRGLCRRILSILRGAGTSIIVCPESDSARR